MQGEFTQDKAIFVQIAEWLEDAILSGAFAEEQQVPSITEFSLNYSVNPATALKGVNLLVDEGVLYKKRGVGMFVAAGARARLQSKRRQGFSRAYVAPMAAEARRLGIGKGEVGEMIDQAFDQTDGTV